MTANTSRGYTYPLSTDHNRLWEHFLALATTINTDVGNLEAAPNGKLITPTGGASIAHNTFTAIGFGSGSEALGWDLLNWHSEVSNTGRVTPTKAGKYRVHGIVCLTTRSDWSGVEVGIQINGGSWATPTRLPSPGVGTLLVENTSLISMNGTTDYFELYCRQTNAASAAATTVVSAHFACELDWQWVSP